jgi:cytochrome c6
MKSLTVMLLAVVTGFMLWMATPAVAADLGRGAQVFSANCAACHIGGGNVVNGAKTLKKEALAQYDMNSIEAITTQIKNGKSAMPAFLGRLTDEDIANVAAYVLDQSEKGW